MKTNAELIADLLMLARILAVAPRRMTDKGAVIKALVPAQFLASVQLAADALEEKATTA